MTLTTPMLPEAREAGETMLEACGPDGHLVDVALSCIADGELAIVPAAALEHLDRCDHCARRLGEAALLSVATGDALLTMGLRPEAGAALVPAASVASLVPASAPAPRVDARRARRPLPVAAIAAALALVALTAGPSVVDAIRSAPATIAAAVGSAPFLARVGAAFLRGAPWGLGDATLLVQGVSALVMMAVGLQVARVRSRHLAGTDGVNGGEA